MANPKKLPTLYALYIFNRRCQCIFYQNYTQQPIAAQVQVAQQSNTATISQSTSSGGVPPTKELQAMTLMQSASQESLHSRRASVLTQQQQQHALQPTAKQSPDGMPWEEHVKLIYGLLFSLSNTVNKLATRQP